MPGLAAVLAAYLPRLPAAASFDPARGELAWRCLVEVPRPPDPQHPECLYRLARFQDQDLPGLAGAGRAAAPFCIEVALLRKGSFIDGGRVDPGGVDFLLWLTGARWPEEWGGHLELLDGGGAVRERRAPGFDALDLLGPGQRFRVPVVTAHVEALLVRGRLEAA